MMVFFTICAGIARKQVSCQDVVNEMNFLKDAKLWRECDPDA